MASTTRASDDIAESIKTLIDRVVDAKVTHEVARRGHDLAGVLADRSAELGGIANEAWRDTRPMRRDAAKRLSREYGQATKRADRTWRKTLRPFVKDLWNQRTIAAGAAGAALPAGRELVDTAAVRLGLRRQEERHWGAFFLGLLLGAAGGAIVALLTAPKRGEEMRREVAQRADELATKARDEWVPLFQSGATNGHTAGGTMAEASTATSGSLEEAATEGGIASGEAADLAAADAAEAINETYEPVDRESTT